MMKKVSKISLISISISLFLYSQMSHALIRYSPSGGGYRIHLASYNSKLSDTPTVGSDGEKYYLIARPNSSGYIVDYQSSQAFGKVNCTVNYLEGNYQKGVGPDRVFHRIFAYMPNAGFTLQGLTAYRINENTYFTMYSSQGMTEAWIRQAGGACARGNMERLFDAGEFATQFPFEIRIYVRNIPIDGKVIVPQAVIAGYTRIYQDTGKPDMFVPEDKASIKLHLSQSVVNYPSNCKSSLDNLNINHSTLDSMDFNDRKIASVTYQCKQNQSVKVQLKLDYTTDSDPQKRVPLKSGNNTIYSELSLYDADSNQRGKTIVATIDKVKNIEIESHLYGLNATPGKYTGNAWLIATYL